jgi:ferric-dicitrate binding protein FerR (iron transport regulator)
MHEVEAAVRAEWQQVVQARRRQRRTRTWAAAAAVAALAVGVTIAVQIADVRAQPIATLQRSDGEIFIAADGDHWNRLRAGQRIRVGDFVRSEAPAALRLESGDALRIDRGTALQAMAADRLALNAGAVYIDSPPGRGADALVIDTHAGSVRHVGTQYQVRTRPDGIELSVREGQVLVEHAASSSTAAAGERLNISTQGSVQRSAISASDAQWQWASDIAPPFDIENQPLAMFLAWVARETGRTLVYESPLVRTTATTVTLHGSIEGLAPEAALAAVLTTTSLQRKESGAESIAIGFSDAMQPARETRRPL